MSDPHVIRCSLCVKMKEQSQPSNMEKKFPVFLPRHGRVSDQKKEFNETIAKQIKLSAA